MLSPLPAVPSKAKNLVAGDLFAETIPAILKRRAGEWPRQTFLQQWNPDTDTVDSLTYGQFYEKVCAAAYVLDTLGVERSTKVGVRVAIAACHT
jgi:acyl-CoA synthetase (AMP-forming)/AMP-acid ligase II